eukprot:9838039-Lingulodinium_polyedra.AAC.1
MKCVSGIGLCARGSAVVASPVCAMPGAGLPCAACGATSTRSRRASCAPQSPGGATAGPAATSAR